MPDNITHHLRSRAGVLYCDYCSQPASELGPDPTTVTCQGRLTYGVWCPHMSTWVDLMQSLTWDQAEKLLRRVTVTGDRSKVASGICLAQHEIRPTNGA